MSDSIVFDRAAGYYDATRGFPPGAEETVADAFAAAGALGPRSRVLEVGVGTGRIAVPLAARVGRLVGVDRSGPMLARLVAKRGALPIEPVRADATRLPLPGACVDAAVAVHVFHLIPGWRAVLAELTRVVGPDGLLLHGGDDPWRGETWRRWRERMEAEPGLGSAGVARSRIRTFLRDEGWEPVGEQRLAFSRRLRPRDLVTVIEERLWSTCWSMSDEQVRALADEMRHELRERFGDLEREVELETGFWIQAFRPPRAV